METKKRRKYDADFKAEVLKMLTSGQPATPISEKLGIGENLIYRWKKEVAGQKVDKATLLSTETAPLSERIESLQKELKKAETERDIMEPMHT